MEPRARYLERNAFYREIFKDQVRRPQNLVILPSPLVVGEKVFTPVFRIKREHGISGLNHNFIDPVSTISRQVSVHK